MKQKYLFGILFVWVSVISYIIVSPMINISSKARAATFAIAKCTGSSVIPGTGYHSGSGGVETNLGQWIYVADRWTSCAAGQVVKSVKLRRQDTAGAESIIIDVECCSL